MFQLHFTGDTVLMSDDVCHALLRYARALADTHTSDIVSIPVVTDTGEVTIAEFLLGPASQLFATRVPGMAEKGTDAAVAADLAQRTGRLRPSKAAALEPPDADAFDDTE